MGKNIDIGLLILRISVGGFMLLHGIKKIGMELTFIEELVGKIGLPPFFANGVYIGELIAPLMIILGYKTRFASLLLFLTCLFIIFIAHPSDILKFNDYGGWQLELPGLFATGSLALIFTGGGKYALSKDDKLVPFWR